MKPYYQDDYVTLYHGDCLELADLWTGADVLVTDPPYGIAWKQHHGGYKGGGSLKQTRNAVANDQTI